MKIVIFAQKTWHREFWWIFDDIFDPFLWSILIKNFRGFWKKDENVENVEIRQNRQNRQKFQKVQKSAQNRLFSV